MNHIDTKKQLLDSVSEARGQIEAFVAVLTSAQLTEPRDAGGWAVKDHLAHLAAWQNGMTALLQYQPPTEAGTLARRDTEFDQGTSASLRPNAF